MMRALAGTLEQPVRPVEVAGWNGDALEAQAFGVLAARCWHGLPITFPGTTGAPRPLAGGRIVRAVEPKAAARSGLGGDAGGGWQCRVETTPFA